MVRERSWNPTGKETVQWVIPLLGHKSANPFLPLRSRNFLVNTPWLTTKPGCSFSDSRRGTEQVRTVTRGWKARLKPKDVVGGAPCREAMNRWGESSTRKDMPSRQERISVSGDTDKVYTEVQRKKKHSQSGVWPPRDWPPPSSAILWFSHPRIWSKVNAAGTWIWMLSHPQGWKEHSWKLNYRPFVWNTCSRYGVVKRCHLGNMACGLECFLGLGWWKDTILEARSFV